ncbi:MAG: Endoribonuclease YbeY [candidate division TA06 bacterium ADurb.Bin417]|uniref:Endoribonuclease YbeY n=1 Tax=candidate division TA06 bacterium ADurb.Bin417 TaxID=1852828 RepID=A0A1V5MKH2_UNCT6|nr:MAG: Endoribonuclease YbeY [candidate division TA06 bacterium ADurb.Bin417]
MVLLSDRAIAVYNSRFLGLNRPTDVLSFKLDPGEGEVLISAETARRQAEELGHSLEQELMILAIHGFLHLQGFLDYKPADRRRMEAETRRLLRLAGRET